MKAEIISKNTISLNLETKLEKIVLKEMMGKPGNKRSVYISSQTADENGLYNLHIKIQKEEN